MADNNNFVQLQDLFLSGSGVTSTATSITLKAMKQIDTTTTVTMTDFGDTGYATLEPNTIREENISFTGITQNASGTATLTGVTRGLKFVADYTQDTALRQSHAGGTLAVISNSAPFYNELGSKDNDETITGKYTFPTGGATNAPVSGTSYTAPTDNLEYAAKEYVDNVAIAGAPDANATTKGIVEIGTLAEIRAATPNTGSTGAILVPDNTSQGFVRQEHITQSFQYGETVTAGNVLYMDSVTGKWKLADGSAASTADDSVGVAYNSGVLDDYGTVLLPGSNVATVTGIAAATAGDLIYLSDTAGTAATTAGTYKKVLGVALSATAMMFLPQQRVEELSGVNTVTTTANLNESMTFFENTDITGAEAETLTDTSSADALHTHTYCEKLTVFTTDVDIADTNETTVLTVSVPANTLSTANGIKGRIYFDDLDSVGATTLTMRLKYGATTLVSRATSSLGATNNNKGWVDFLLLAAGATNSQEGALTILYSTGAVDAKSQLGVGTAAEDSTGALTLVVTAQLGASMSASFAMGYAEIIR